MSIADAQGKLRDLNICSLAYRTASDDLVFCGESLENCPMHSTRTRRLAEARLALKSLEDYEDCHTSVYGGGLCLSEALTLANKKIAEWEAAT